jgi:malonyl-CoA O-methyltransferase
MYEPMLSQADFDELPAREGYDRWSAIYDNEDNPLILLETPRVRELLGDVASLRVIDVGCGTGRHTLPLADRGAIVTAVEFSDGMLQKASAKPGWDRIRVIRQNIESTLAVEGASFDRVLCALVVEHIRNLEPLFGELARICAPDGCVVVSAMHPAMMLKGISARFTDPRTGRDTRPKSHPNSIADFLNAAMKAGLELDHISESAIDGRLAKISPRGAKYEGWPMLLALRFRRRLGS